MVGLREDLTAQLDQTQAELAQARAQIATLEAQLAQCLSTAIRDARILQYIAEYSWDAFVLVNDRGTIEYVSPAITRLLGYSVPEYIQLGINELTHPDDRLLAGTLLQELLATPDEHRTFEIRGRHKAGHWLWLEMTAVNYLHNPDLHAILVNSRDITERKTTQLELQATVERYRLLSDSITDALFVLALDDAGTPGQLLEVNESACQLLGYSREELLQLNLVAIDAPDSPTPKQTILQRLQNGEQVSFEQIHLGRNGSRIPVEVHARMGMIQGKNVIISLAHDISRRKLAEQELRRFEAVIRQTDDAVVITDAPTQQKPTILFANDAFTRITGYNQQEALEQKVNILQFSGTSVETHEEVCALHAVLLRGEVYRGTTHSYHKQGMPLTLQWSITPLVDQQATVTHFVAIIRDITAQEQQVAQLQAAKSDLQAYQASLNGILDTMEDALVSLSLPDQQLIYASASFTQIFGYPLQRFLSEPLFFQQIVHPDDLAITLAARQRVLQDGFVELVHRIILPDGQVRWLQRRAWMNYNADGRPIRLNDSARDITAQKQADEALRQSETYLRSLVDSQTAFNLRVNMQGKITYCNNRYIKHFGWAAPALIGSPALQTILPEDHAKVQAVIGQCLAQVGMPVQAEIRKPTQTGGYLWTIWEFIAVPNQDGIVDEVQCVGFDITQQKLAEAELRASEKRYRQMFELHGLPKLIIDPANGRILDANPAAGQFYGYAVAVLKTLTIFDVNLSPLDEVQTKMAKAAAATMLSCEFVHRGANGGPRNVEIFTGPVESEGKHLLYSIITDTTEKQRAQGALQEAHDLLEARVIERTAELEKVMNRLEAIFNHSGDAILLLDIERGIQQANHAFDAHFAQAGDNYIGRQLSSFFQPLSELDLAATIAEVARTHQTHHVEAQATQANGLPLDVEISVAPVNRSAQAVTNIVCIIRDITERKKAELTIAEERNLLRTLIDAVPDFIYVKDRDHRLVLNNVAHARSIGYTTPAAAVGKSDADLFPPAMAAKFYVDEVQIFQSGLPILATEERSLAQDGSLMWALTTKVPLRNLKGECIGIVGITHNISQLKETEEALRYHEQQARDAQKMLQLVLDTIPVSVFWKDCASVYQGCNRIFADDAGLRHTADIVGRRDEDLPWLTSETTIIKADDHAVMTSGLPKLAYEETISTATGKQLLIQTNKLPLRNEANHVIGVLGAYVDITEHKATEDALRASEEKFRQLIESAPIATIITEATGDIVLVNRQAEQLFGYSRQELIGHCVDLLVPTEARTTHGRHRTTYTTVPEKRRAMLMELQGQRKDNTVFPLDLQLSYIEMEPAPLVMSFILDTTERKQAEGALKQALAQEKELGELKSRFVSMASHEFRTPLTVILANTETLSHYRHKMNPTQIDARLVKIRQQVIYMKEIMEDVLQLARIQAGHVEFHPLTGDLDSLCQEITEEFDGQAAYRDRIVYQCTTAPVLTAFDRRLMRQIISNLLLNALKYSAAEKLINLTLTHDDNQVCLQVRDEGIGIPPDDLKHLFEPFHRATNVGTISGTGLGLSITKQAVELHGGTITPVSQVGSGTTFTVTLPKGVVIGAEPSDDSNIIA